MRRKLLSIFICVVMVTNLFGVIAQNVGQPSSSGTIYVDDDNTSGIEDGSLQYPYNTIQEGVNAASNGDTVYVFNGMYYEHVSISKSYIILHGENIGKTRIDGGGSGNVIYVETDYADISGFTIQNGGRTGIYVANSIGITISDNFISSSISNNRGIYLSQSVQCDIYENTIQDNNGKGIFLNVNCIYNDIFKNNLINNKHEGIRLAEHSNNNNIFENIIQSSYGTGIWITQSSDGNTIRNNIIMDHPHSAIKVANTYPYGNNNRIYHNNFINNIASDGGTNIWDDGYPSGGNYWSDYGGNDIYRGSNQDIPGSDGIGDTPYPIPDGSNQDRYPFMNPLSIFNNPPVANAGPDQTVNEGDIVDFNGSASYDSDGTIESYEWDFGDGSPIGLGIVPSHIYNSPANHTVTLTVTDNDGATYTDTCTITVLPSLQPPVADAGPDQTTREGDVVQFFGCNSTGSTDGNPPSINPDVVALWHMDEGSGSIICDETENNNDGTINGAAWTADGKFGNALSFDGGNDYVDCGNGTSLDITDAITIEAWARPYSTDGYRGIVDKDNAYKFQIYDGNVQGRVLIGPAWKTATGVTELQNGKWYHLAFTYDGSMLRVYVDGKEDGNFSFTGSIRSQPSNPLIIGNKDWNQLFNGFIDELVIWNRALSAQEILDYYNSGKEHFASGETQISSYEWDFDSDFDSDGDGDPTNDVDATGPAPTYIYGDDGVYEVTLTVKTTVEGETTFKSDLDVVFCIDSTGSMDWNDPNDLRIVESQNFVANYFSPDDRGAVVDFDAVGILVNDHHLSMEYAQIINDLGEIDASGGTDISRGLNVSITELLDYGVPDHTQVIILITDGGNNDPAMDIVCRNLAAIAAANNIIIITIGLTMAPGGDPELLLMDITNITGGKYFPAPDASYFEEIYEEISVIIENETSEELSDTDTCYVTVRNVSPGATLPVIFGYGEEGSPFHGLVADAIDAGSDDLTFKWYHGDGTNETLVYYNNGVGPEPIYDSSTNEVRSSWGTFPFSVSDKKIHIYGDDGVYYNRVTITDDDGGVTNFVPMIPTIENVPPILSANIPKNADEGEEVLFTADGFDNGTDDLTFTWSWGDGTPDTVTTHYNNGVSPEPVYDPATNEVKSPWGIYPFTVVDSVTHIYGDDGIYNIMIMVEDDDGGENTYNTTITVNNVAPSIIEIIISYPAEEGIESTFRATVKDEGSDDLTFEWDFSDLISTAPNTYYNNGINPDPDPSPGGTYPFIAQDTVEHTYGDDYDYNLTLTVTDDDDGVTTFTTTVIVRNVAPTIEPFGPFTVDEGSPFDITTSSTDPGSDDLIFEWEFEDGPTITNTHYNDGVGSDPYPSPWGTYPFLATDTAEHTYGDDGNFTIALTVTDDDGGSGVYETYVLVNNVPPSISSINYTVAIINEPRTIGYWGHQCEVEEPYGDHTGILQEWVDNISSQSKIFSWITTEEDVCSVVQEGDASDMVVMAKRQLMGVWLNIVSGKLHPMSEIYMLNLTFSNIIWEAVQEIEYVILNSNDRAELERVKDIADNINNGRGIALAYVEFVVIVTDPGADDLTFHWDFGDGKSQDHFYPNVNGTYPVEVTDYVGHSYFTLGSFDVTLIVTDDDGGTTTATLVIVLLG